MRANRILAWTGLAAASLLFCGCIQRTITIDSQPSGSLVYLNDEEVGRTPCAVPFTFYGTYDVRLEKEGYTTLSTAQKADGPWWEFPGPDLIATVLPFEFRSDLKWDYTLLPAQPVEPEVLVDHANQLRAAMTQPAK